jgi:hypothetical protein
MTILMSSALDSSCGGATAVTISDDCIGDDCISDDYISDDYIDELRARLLLRRQLSVIRSSPCSQPSPMQSPRTRSRSTLFLRRRGSRRRHRDVATDMVAADDLRAEAVAANAVTTSSHPLITMQPANPNSSPCSHPIRSSPCSQPSPMQSPLAWWPPRMISVRAPPPDAAATNTAIANMVIAQRRHH